MSLKRTGLGANSVDTRRAAELVWTGSTLFIQECLFKKSG